MKYNLSEVTEIIKNRRSIPPEAYTERKVHLEIVKNILQNATWAPSHGMTQPWHFKVYSGDGLVRLSEELPKLYQQETAPADFNPKKQEKFANRLKSISVVVMICMKRGDNPKIPVIEEVEAVACAVQNMHLTCTAYGIGAYWSSSKFIYTPAMNALLDLGDQDQCLGLFYMGYPSGEWPSGHRRPLEYVTEWIDA